MVSVIDSSQCKLVHTDIKFTGFCQHPCRPEIIDFSHFHEFIKWNSPLCSNTPQISQYQILIKDTVEGHVRINNTNETIIEFECQNYCYFIVKAQFEDYSESHFSSCLDVSGQLLEIKGIYLHIYNLISGLV